MIHIFGGTGFIGSKFHSTYNEYSIVVPKSNYDVPNNSSVLYLISTVDNYNVLNNPFIDIETNLTYLMKVLDANKEKNIDFTFVSSWFVYGDTNLPATEKSPCKPKGFYSITKLAAEQLLESYCKTFNIKYKIVRLGNVIGKGDSKVSKKKNALQFLIEEMKMNHDINLYNKGEFYRDFVHVDDVVEGLKFIIDHGQNGEIYNLGSNKSPILFKEIIEYAKKEIGSNSNIGTMEPTDFHKIVQVQSMYLDSSKLASLGFSPSKDIYQAVKEML
jgi:nucleoside-diphosphate-sugar epimerase